MNLQTIIVAGIVAIIFIAIIAKALYNKKSGKSSCACGGNCSTCGHCRH